LRTIDRLLAEGWFTRTSIWAAMANYLIDDRRLGAEPYEFTYGSRHETRLAQKQSETFLVAHALAGLGYREVALQSRESPDFRATLPAGAGAVGIEVAELVEPESACWRNAIENVCVRVRDAVDADPDLQAAIAGRYIDIRLLQCPKRAAERRLVSEIQALLRSYALTARYDGNRIVDDRFPTLTEHCTHLHVTSFAGAHVDISASAHSFDSRSLVPVALEVLRRKQKKAQAYDRTLPLWLVLSVTDQRGVFGDSLDVLESIRASIEPFERVMICNEGRVISWDRRDARCADGEAG
jgi:hypothetical protein